MNSVNFQSITKLSHEYPSRLLELSDPPSRLFIAGEILPEDSLSLGVVGSRKMSSYGRDVCDELVCQVAKMGVTVVSGLMYGVDLAAHRAALKEGGRTIGVLGFGIDFIDKVYDKNIVSEIINGRGAVISEFNQDEKAAPWTFPKRDRIISALSSAVLVVEAAERSGTSYTVTAALELGREVMAVPGSIFSLVSRGTNRMIKDGARPVCSIDDILEVLEVEKNLKRVSFKKQVPVSPDEEALLLVLLEAGESYIDDIAVKSGLAVSKVSALLTTLELKGMVKDMGRGVYRKI